MKHRSSGGCHASPFWVKSRATSPRHSIIIDGCCTAIKQIKHPLATHYRRPAHLSLSPENPAGRHPTSPPPLLPELIKRYTRRNSKIIIITQPPPPGIRVVFRFRERNQRLVLMGFRVPSQGRGVIYHFARARAV